jgi:predicted PurR-regulated permease PerM
MPLSTTRAEKVGWLVLLGLVALFIYLGLLKFLVFLLFMRLVVDLLVHGIGRRVPWFSRTAILYAVYALLAGVIAALAVLVVPRFLTDLPAYARNLDANLGAKIADLLATWNITIDPGDLRLKAAEWGRSHVGESFDLARRAGANVVLLVVALVITFLITHDRLTATDDDAAAVPENLWRFLAAFLSRKVASFYGFFRQVMAGQVIISLINTGLTIGLLVLLGIPHKVALTVMVFIFGLLPVVGNLISNTLICLSAFIWAGPVQVVASLVFLVVIHKLEYFLNGKIIGEIVKLPMALTLLGLIVGESLFHISGMILSIPIILFVRAEVGKVKVADEGR